MTFVYEFTLDHNVLLKGQIKCKNQINTRGFAFDSVAKRPVAALADLVWIVLQFCVCGQTIPVGINRVTSFIMIPCCPVVKHPWQRCKDI